MAYAKAEKYASHDRSNDEEYGLPNYQAVFDYPGFYVMDFPDVSLFVTDSNFVLDQKQEIEVVRPLSQQLRWQIWLNHFPKKGKILPYGYTETGEGACAPISISI